MEKVIREDIAIGPKNEVIVLKMTKNAAGYYRLAVKINGEEYSNTLGIWKNQHIRWAAFAGNLKTGCNYGEYLFNMVMSLEILDFDEVPKSRMYYYNNIERERERAREKERAKREQKMEARI